jgi:hypothetical protein
VRPATQSSLATLTEERLDKQILRTFRHNYGAESALRSAVRTAVAEMEDAGASAEAVKQALAACVDKHAGSVRDKGSLVTGESRASIVTKRLFAWIDEFLAPEPAPASR